MPSGVVRLQDVIVPSVFTPYKQQLTEQKSRIIQSGLAQRDPMLDAFLAGAGLTVNAPSFKDLADDEENTSSDDPTILSTPNKIGTAMEVAVRLSRNNSWSSMDLVQALIAIDPMDVIANRVANYWMRRMQVALMAEIKGVFADNDAAPNGTDTHVQGDLTMDVSGSAYAAGITDFNAAAFIDATTLMGDSKEGLGVVFMHSIVHGRAQKNNLIDYIPDAEGRITIPTFLGREVIIDDAMPNSNGVFETWLAARGAFRIGMGAPKVPTETDRIPAAGNGGGQEVLHDRVEWCIHPEGHAYKGAPPAGGPTNAATTNNLANAASWSRVYSERKQIKLARLVTREYAAA